MKVFHCMTSKWKLIVVEIAKLFWFYNPIVSSNTPRSNFIFLWCDGYWNGWANLHTQLVHTTKKCLQFSLLIMEFNLIVAIPIDANKMQCFSQRTEICAHTHNLQMRANEPISERAAGQADRRTERAQGTSTCSRGHEMYIVLKLIYTHYARCTIYAIFVRLLYSHNWDKSAADAAAYAAVMLWT